MPDITVTYTEQEQQVYVRVLDAAVRQLGLDGADAVVHLKNKLAQASQVAAKNAEIEAAKTS
jgi:hypothetical protein